VVSEPIGNCNRDAGNCSFSLQKPARVSLTASGFCKWLLSQKWLGTVFALGRKWYVEIANLGYSYAEDQQQHSVAFSPLFPLLIRGLTTLGMQVELAGTLINSWAFLGALLVVASC